MLVLMNEKIDRKEIEAGESKDKLREKFIYIIEMLLLLSKEINLSHSLFLD